jgi:hypothetical protein
MATELKEDSDKGYATAGEEEESEQEEESEDLSEGEWGQCPECSSKGPLGHLCSRCKDTGMIYNGPCSSPGSSQEDHFEWDYEARSQGNVR